LLFSFFFSVLAQLLNVFPFVSSWLPRLAWAILLFDSNKPVLRAAGKAPRVSP
jgi:hypothetical protein